MKARQGTAHRYAKALYAVAREEGTAEAIGQDLEGFAGVFAGQPELRGALLRPWIKPAERRGVAVEVAQRSGCGKLAQDFVGLVAARGRMDHLTEIVDAYRGLVDQGLGRARAEVRTATPLTEAEKQQLASHLERAIGKSIVLEETVDPTLLGGFIAQVGGRILDGSLDGQLRVLRERLARG
jgi:F-type H+-transporting ATPase subunit delta